MTTPGVKRSNDSPTPSPPDVKKRYRDDEHISAGEPSSSAAAVGIRQVLSLPKQEVVANTLKNVKSSLKKLFGKVDNDDEAQVKYPVIIGSRAAAFWFPSFRPFADWDLVATPKQTIDIINSIDTHAGNLISISLIKQPLVPAVIRHRPMTPDIQTKIDNLPSDLYKVCGEIEDLLKFEIEIAFQDSQENATTSATDILLMCNGVNNNNDTVVEADQEDGQSAILNFPAGGKGHACLVAPIKLLEALKTSHINWPAYFAKHIADLHALRTLMIPSPTAIDVNVGLYAKKNKPLTAPERTQELEDFIVKRTLEIEAFRGTPGAHINLNVSNEDFLGRDDDLFITRHIPHDDVHDLVKYFDRPIYDTLKTDTSKSMISKKMFQEAPYDKQIKCVKEEAMVIALERFLLPQLSKDPTSAYKQALVRICTTLTKGWFRQFAIDNYHRLAVCENNLMPICNTILTKHPLPARVLGDPMEFVKQSVEHLEDLVVVQKLSELTLNRGESSNFIDDVKSERRKSRREPKRRANNDNDSEEEEESENEDFEDSDDSVCSYGNREYNTDTDEEHYVIKSNNPNAGALAVSLINEDFYDGDNCKPSSYTWATLSVQPLTEDFDKKKLRVWKWNHSEHEMDKFSHYNFHKLSLYLDVCVNDGSWGGGDIWSNPKVYANDLTSEMELLDIEGLNEDLLMTWILALLQPKLHSNGETPLRNIINQRKTDGLIPMAPKNHLWFDIWKYY